MMEEIRSVYRILVGKHEGRHLQRPKHMWQDDVKIDLKELDGKLWTGFIWFDGIVSSGRFCTMEMNLHFLVSGQMTLST